MLEVSPVWKTADRQLYGTLQWAQIGWLNWKLARELQSLNEQEKSCFREEQTKEQTCNSDTDREQGHRERNTEKVHEGHLKEEYEVKVRILQKKEQLLDLNLQLFRRKLNINE